MEAALPKCVFLKKAASVYANQPSLIRFTWSQTYERCRHLASSLCSHGFCFPKNSVVLVLAPNVLAMYEMHFAVPMVGAILNAVNTRLNADNVVAILRHSETKAFFVDWEYVPKAHDAVEILS